tara:strand:- start:10978 stop:11220 length:243 start_codon:yes stop_codon:yes gene_type:complete
MNYQELKDFVNLVVISRSQSEIVLNKMDAAIEALNDYYIGIAINTFIRSSHSFKHDATFARELIDYIDGLKESQDNEAGF